MPSLVRPCSLQVRRISYISSYSLTCYFRLPISYKVRQSVDLRHFQHCPSLLRLFNFALYVCFASLAFKLLLILSQNSPLSTNHVYSNRRALLRLSLPLLQTRCRPMFGKISTRPWCSRKDRLGWIRMRESLQTFCSAEHSTTTPVAGLRLCKWRLELSP